jgi:hypothetical protein
MKTTVKCGKPVFSKNLNKTFPCIQPKGHWHTGKHTADLTGLKLKHGVVLKRGRVRIEKCSGVRQTTWIVKQDCGTLKTLLASSILDGASTLRYVSNKWTTNKGKSTPELHTVHNHHSCIFKQSLYNPLLHGYKNMPFCDDWNPDKGGAYWKGAKWIIEHLGKRPGPDWSMDIINHAKGFVPGNLRWATRGKQKHNQQYRVLGQLTDKEFKVEARRRGFKI